MGKHQEKTKPQSTEQLAALDRALGRYLIYRRRRAGLSRAELSARSGVPLEWVIKRERGETPSQLMAIRMGKVLGVGEGEIARRSAHRILSLEELEAREVPAEQVLSRRALRRIKSRAH